MWKQTNGKKGDYTSTYFDEDAHALYIADRNNDVDNAGKGK